MRPGEGRTVHTGERRALAAVDQHPVLRPAPPYRHVQRLQHHIGGLPAPHRPTHHTARKETPPSPADAEPLRNLCYRIPTRSDPGHRLSKSPASAELMLTGGRLIWQSPRTLRGSLQKGLRTACATVAENHSFPRVCGCSSMVEQQLPKLNTRVRFPSPAPFPMLQD